MKKLCVLVWLVLAASFANSFGGVEFTAFNGKAIDCAAPMLSQPGGSVSVDVAVSETDSTSTATSWDVEVYLVQLVSFDGSDFAFLEKPEGSLAAKTEGLKMRVADLRKPAAPGASAAAKFICT